MAQKIAPAALRLYTNKKFDASWFSDRMYGSLLQQTLNIKKFVHSIFESIGTKTALSHVQATPQHIYIQSFFCSPRVMNQRLRKKYVSLESNTQFLHPFEAYLTLKEKFGRYPLFAICMGAGHKKWETFQHIGFMHLLLMLQYRSSKKNLVWNTSNKTMSAIMLKKNGNMYNHKKLWPILDNSEQKTNQVVTKYASHIENVLALYLQKKVVWTPYKIKHAFTSASFVAHYIALQFEQNKKKPFRSIFQDVLKQCVKTPQLIGIRIAIAGRIGGAEMARVERTQYGQTSLHVFSHTIDYHRTSAYTPHGLLGVKVWMSFKS
tara:strand:+ start:309 stop:1268 length:960 start_codon:yes stop_codon:yes gene_type:complete